MAAPPPPPSLPHFLVILDIETTCDDVSDPRHPEVVEFPWLVYHVASRSVLDTKQLFVAPSWNCNPNPPPDAVRALRTDVAFAPTLADALLQFDTYVYHSFVLPAKPFVLVTDGHWDIAHVLLSDAAQKALALAPHFRTYVDLRAEFSRCYPAAPAPADRKTMFSFLRISTAPRASGVDECVALAGVVTRLLADGHAFGRPLLIPDYEWGALPAHIPAVAAPVATAVAVCAIVRLRGLPWTCCEADVAHFLSGIALVPNGIHFVRNAHGKPTGEAFVQLESAHALPLALARHKHTVGRRYIEVFKSSPVDMANHLGRAEGRRRAAGWNKRKSWSGAVGRQRAKRAGKDEGAGEAHVVVKVSGLGRHTREHDVGELLQGLEVGDGGDVHVVRTATGECGGEAFVQVRSEAAAKTVVGRSGGQLAVSDGHGGAESCTVQVAVSSSDEMRRAAAAATGGEDEGWAAGDKEHEGGRFYAGVRKTGGETVGEAEVRELLGALQVAEGEVEVGGGEAGGGGRVRFSSRERRDAAVRRWRQRGGAAAAGGCELWAAEEEEEGGGGAERRTVKMRGLPYSATEADIARFFEGFAIEEGGIWRGRDRHGRASGEAWVRLRSAGDARAAVAQLDKRHMGSRYIELRL